MKISKGLLGVLVVLAAAAPAMARSAHQQGTLRERQEQACYGDATTLCGDFVPDEAKVTTCMTAKKAQLSPGCRAVFK